MESLDRIHSEQPDSTNDTNYEHVQAAESSLCYEVLPANVNQHHDSTNETGGLNANREVPGRLGDVSSLQSTSDIVDLRSDELDARVPLLQLHITTSQEFACRSEESVGNNATMCQYTPFPDMQVDHDQDQRTSHLRIPSGNTATNVQDFYQYCSDRDATATSCISLHDNTMDVDDAKQRSSNMSLGSYAAGGLSAENKLAANQVMTLDRFSDDEQAENCCPPESRTSENTSQEIAARERAAAVQCIDLDALNYGQTFLKNTTSLSNNNFPYAPQNTHGKRILVREDYETDRKRIRSMESSVQEQLVHVGTRTQVALCGVGLQDTNQADVGVVRNPVCNPELCIADVIPQRIRREDQTVEFDDYFTEKEYFMRMSEYHKKILHVGEEVLTSCLSFNSEFLQTLVSRRTLLKSDIESVKSKLDQKDKVLTLLESLRRRQDSAFYSFITTLVDTEQQHVANTLLEHALDICLRINIQPNQQGAGSTRELKDTIKYLEKEGERRVRASINSRRGVYQPEEHDEQMQKIRTFTRMVQNFAFIIDTACGSILLFVRCLSRSHLAELEALCRDDDVLEACKEAFVPDEYINDLEVTMTINTNEFLERDRLFCFLTPIDRLPVEILQEIFKFVKIGEEEGLPTNFTGVCTKWNGLLQHTGFKKSYKKFVEAHIYPYLRKPKLTTTIRDPGNRPIIGVAVLDHYLYVAHTGSTEIDIYDIDADHILCERKLHIQHATQPFNMALSERKRCLYLTDYAPELRGCVWKISVDADDVVGPWVSNFGRALGVSVVPNTDDVIVVCELPNSLRVYADGDASQLREIALPEVELDAPRQAVQLNNDTLRYALIHGYMGPTNRLVELDVSEDDSAIVNRIYGAERGTGRQQLNWPAALISDSRGRMLIGDRENHRVHLVSPKSFKLVRYLLTSEMGIVGPRRLFLDAPRGVLYVAQTDHVIKVFKIARPETRRPTGSTFTGRPQPKDGTMPTGVGTDDSTEDPSLLRKRKLDKHYKILRLRGQPTPAQNINELPSDLLEQILAEVAVSAGGSTGELEHVCVKWTELIGQIHFKHVLQAAQLQAAAHSSATPTSSGQ